MALVKAAISLFLIVILLDSLNLRLPRLKTFKKAYYPYAFLDSPMHLSRRDQVEHFNYHRITLLYVI